MALVIVLPCTIQGAVASVSDIRLVGIAQGNPVDRFLPSFQAIFATKGSESGADF